MSLPDEVAAVAADLRGGLEDIFGPTLAGLFVYGAALFPHPVTWRLDFDFHALLEYPIGPAEQTRVDSLYATLAARSELGRDLDGYFVLRRDAAKPEPPVHQLDPTVRDEAWALHRAHVHAGRYVTICGADPREIVPVPTWPELDAALRAELDFIDTHPDATAFGILNGARILASYDRGDVVLSKYEASEWALATLPARWHDLVGAAVRVYERTPREHDEAALRDEWADFVAFVRSRLPVT